MEVILRQDIDKLGSRGDIVTVADGYARNYLLPKRLAVPATEANKKIVAQEREAHLRREAKAKAEAEQLAKLMEGLTLTIEHKAGEHDQLFGSVTARNIADALAKQNFTIDHRKVQLEDPIKQLGEYRVPIKLHREVTVEIGVQVVPEGGVPAATQAEAAETETEKAEPGEEESASGQPEQPAAAGEAEE